MRGPRRQPRECAGWRGRGAGRLARRRSWAPGRLEDATQVYTVSAIVEGGGEAFELRGVDVSGAIGDLFGTGDLQSLALLDGLDESGSFEQRVVRAGVEPCHATAHDLGVQLAAIEIEPVEVGDLQLIALGRLQAARQLDDLLVVEIEAGDGITGLGLLGLFFQG